MRRLVILWLVLVGCVLGSDAAAGRIFGDITLGGKPVPAGIKLRIALAAPANAAGTALSPAIVATDSTTTDKYGSYKLFVKQEGKCMLTLVYDRQASTLDVYSYGDPTRYDLIVDKADGALSLRRK
jgi:hypothetical protein